jgi:hypothetical protein
LDARALRKVCTALVDVDSIALAKEITINDCHLVNSDGLAALLLPSQANKREDICHRLVFLQ